MASTFVRSCFNPSLVGRCLRYVICDFANTHLCLFNFRPYLRSLLKTSVSLFMCSSIVFDRTIMSSWEFLVPSILSMTFATSFWNTSLAQ